MIFFFQVIFLQHGISGRGLEPIGPSGEDGIFGLFIILITVFVIYSLYKSIQSKKIIKEEKLKRNNNEIIINKYSENIKNYFLKELSITADEYENKYHDIVQVISEFIVKNQIGDIQISLIFSYIYNILLFVESTSAEKINNSIQERYGLLNYNLFLLVPPDYKKNYKYLKLITEHIIGIEAYHFLTPKHSSPEIVKKKLIELNDLFTEKNLSIST